MEDKKQISETIIDSYYQRFYQGRKSKKYHHNHQQPPAKLIPQKQNLVFNINYETNGSPSKSNHLNLSYSQTLQKNTTNSKKQSSNIQNNYKMKNSSLKSTINSALIQKNSLTLEINIPNVPQNSKKTKINTKSSSPIKNLIKIQNFNHFPQKNTYIKNHTHKNQNNTNHFIQAHSYSKTLDFDNFNPENALQHFSRTIETSPQKENEFFTLNNFSHIKLHNDKKKPKASKMKEIVDIVKRKEMSPQKNCRKRSLTNNFISQEKNSPSSNEEISKNHHESKKGLFNEFKPTVELKKRPSTGIPMKRNKTLYLAVQNDKRNMSPNPKSNESIHNRYDSVLNGLFQHSPNKNHQNHDPFKHSRASSLKIDSARRLSVKTREIHSLKYVDLSESEKIKDFFRNSEDFHSKQLKNIVHLEFHRKNSLINKKVNKNKQIIVQDDFLPWQSAQNNDEIIEIN